MGYSRTEYPYTGGAQDFVFTPALGVLDPLDVQVYVAGEVDGLGDQLYRAYTWISTDTVRVTAPLPNPCSLFIQRTVSKDTLETDFSGTGAVTKTSLARGFKQLMMNIHELLDGRLDSFSGPLVDSVAGIRDEAQVARVAAELAAVAAQAAADGVDVFVAAATASANAAAASAAAASGSASGAAGSAAAAAGSVTAADTKAAEAAASVVAAAAHVGTAATHAATANTKAGEASTSADAAAASALAAAGSATTAGTQAGIATTKASEAAADAAAADAARVAAEAAAAGAGSNPNAVLRDAPAPAGALLYSKDATGLLSLPSRLRHNDPVGKIGAPTLLLGRNDAELMLGLSALDFAEAFSVPNGGANTFSSVGCTLASVGTAAAVVPAGTSARALLPNIEHTAVAATTAVVGTRWSGIRYSTGTGFHARFRFLPITGSANAARRYYAGMMTDASAQTDAAIGSTSTVGVWLSSASAAAATVVRLRGVTGGLSDTVNLPVEFNAPAVDRPDFVFDFQIETCQTAGSDQFAFKVQRLTLLSGRVVVEHEFTGLIGDTNRNDTDGRKIPFTTLLAPRMGLGAGGVSSVVGLATFGIGVRAYM